MNFDFQIDDEEIQKEFNDSINSVTSIISFSLLVFAPLPGMFIDYCRRTSTDERRGFTFGSTIIFVIAGILNVSGSILMGIRNDTTAYATVFGKFRG